MLRGLLLKLIYNRSIIVIAPHYTGDHSTIVYTRDGSLKLSMTVENVMNEICLCFGADLNGRISGTRKGLNFRKNPPILISEMLKMVAFQLPSEYKKESMWVFDLTFGLAETESKTKMIFGNDLILETNLSKGRINNRRIQAIQLLHELTYSKMK